MPAIAGPFDLGNVVVRATVEIDPHTAQLTISSGPLPTIEEGIPLDIRTLNADDRSAGLDPQPDRLRAADGRRHDLLGRRRRAPRCPARSRPPTARACRSSRGSRRSRTRRASKAGRRLPAREGRLRPGPGEHREGQDRPPQAAALAADDVAESLRRRAVFEADPAACPAASIVGTGTVDHAAARGRAQRTRLPRLPRRRCASPALVIVLQGEGVEIELEGQTDISKGIASSAFRSLPDVPIDTLDLVFPVGPHSAFAVNPRGEAKGGLCAQTLNMPTAITGQNGAQLKRTMQDRNHRMPTHPRAAEARQAEAAGRAGEAGPGALRSEGRAAMTARRRSRPASGGCSGCRRPHCCSAPRSRLAPAAARGPSPERRLSLVCGLSAEQPEDRRVLLRPAPKAAS